MNTGKHNIHYYQHFQDLSHYPIGSEGWKSYLDYIREIVRSIRKSIGAIALIFLIACNEISQVQEQKELGTIDINWIEWYYIGVVVLTVFFVILTYRYFKTLNYE